MVNPVTAQVLSGILGQPHQMVSRLTSDLIAFPHEKRNPRGGGLSRTIRGFKIRVGLLDRNKKRQAHNSISLETSAPACLLCNRPLYNKNVGLGAQIKMMTLRGPPKWTRTTWISAYTARGPEKDTEVRRESCLQTKHNEMLPGV